MNVNKYLLTKTNDLVEKARAGEAEAQLELGRRLYQGKGVEKSYELARDWFEAAADQGNAVACYEFAEMLLCGFGGAPDPEKAVSYFRTASEAGIRDAMFELGAMYAAGNGVKKNYVKAMKYLRGSGTMEAMSLLAEAPNWWKPAAEQGITEAEYKYGVCCVNAYGIEQDCAEGYKWIYKAALKDHAKAIDAMSQIYEMGLGVLPDKNKALFWKQKYCEVAGVSPEEVGIKNDLFDSDVATPPTEDNNQS